MVTLAAITDFARWHRSLVVWGSWVALFLGLELTPVFWAACPWETLSGTVWDTQDWWHLFRALVAVFLFALSLHFALRVPAAWLITVVVGAAAALALHLLLRKLGHEPGWLKLNRPVLR